jgi:hypothetical protein
VWQPRWRPHVLFLCHAAGRQACQPSTTAGLRDLGASDAAPDPLRTLDHIGNSREISRI